VGQPIHHGRDAVVFRVNGLLDRPLAIKHFREPGASGFLKRLLRGSRARRAWRALYQLEMAEIPTPSPWLFLESSWAAPGRDSFLVTDFLDGARALNHGARQSLPRPAVLRTLAGQIARAHDDCLRNRDLKAENLLVDPGGRHLWWIDPDGVRRTGRIGLDVAARDLMRLNASFDANCGLPPTTRWRFLKAYCASRHTPVPPLRELGRAICLLSAEKWKGWSRAARGDEVEE
jgi:tRNA A-37 threonylcarbamoyl transferase component Bud32